MRKTILLALLLVGLTGCGSNKEIVELEEIDRANEKISILEEEIKSLEDKIDKIAKDMENIKDVEPDEDIEVVEENKMYKYEIMVPDDLNKFSKYFSTQNITSILGEPYLIEADDYYEGLVNYYYDGCSLLVDGDEDQYTYEVEVTVPLDFGNDFIRGIKVGDSIDDIKSKFSINYDYIYAFDDKFNIKDEEIDKMVQLNYNTSQEMLEKLSNEDKNKDILSFNVDDQTNDATKTRQIRFIIGYPYTGESVGFITIDLDSNGIIKSMFIVG